MRYWLLKDGAWSCEGEKSDLGMGDLLWHEVFGGDLGEGPSGNKWWEKKLERLGKSCFFFVFVSCFFKGV